MKNATFHHEHGTRPIAHENWEGFVAAGGYKAVVFDCDGTLVESAEAHFNSFRDAANAQGATLEKAWYEQRTGLDRYSLLTEFTKLTGDAFNIDLAVQESIKAFGNHLHLVQAVPETSRLLLRLSSKLQIAVGTNAETEVAEQSLAKAGLIDAVRFIVSVSDGLPPKPSPEIFAKAARRLDCPPRLALVVEDSKQGVQAARSAGMDVLKINL